jgi:hypothetical protein
MRTTNANNKQHCTSRGDLQSARRAALIRELGAWPINDKGCEAKALADSSNAERTDVVGQRIEHFAAVARQCEQIRSALGLYLVAAAQQERRQPLPARRGVNGASRADDKLTKEAGRPALAGAL